MAGETAEERRARAALDPDRWRVGGSPGTASCTIYQGNRFVGSVRDGRDAEFLVATANAWQEFEGAAHRPAQDGCPTCSGSFRQTVGLVCQTCGTDYGRPAEGDQLDAERRGHTPT